MKPSTFVLSVVNRVRISVLWAFLPCVCSLLAGGCGASDRIAIDLSAPTPRFILNKPTWGWPFRWPMVNALAIASKQDGALWEIRTTDPDGLAAHRLAIIYGQIPPGFYQVVPDDNAHPPPLRAGRNYFVGATGPDATFRAVFALPIQAGTAPPPPDLPPGAKRFGDRPTVDGGGRIHTTTHAAPARFFCASFFGQDRAPLAK